MPVVENMVDGLRNQLWPRACSIGQVCCTDLFLGDSDASVLEEYLDEVEDMGDEEVDPDRKDDEEGDEEVSPHFQIRRQCAGLRMLELG